MEYQQELRKVEHVESKKHKDYKCVSGSTKKIFCPKTSAGTRRTNKLIIITKRDRKENLGKIIEELIERTLNENRRLNVLKETDTQKKTSLTN